MKKLNVSKPVNTDLNNNDLLNSTVVSSNALFYQNLENNFSMETQAIEKVFVSVVTQTDSINTTKYVAIQQKINMDNIRDLICILVDFIPQFGAVHCRILSTIIYLLLRNLEMPYEKCRDMLKVLGLLSIQTVHSWVLTIIDEDDICIILRDGRKGHKNNKKFENKK
jgi:hypothetical protein